MGNEIRDAIPGGLGHLVPYRIMGRIFVSFAMGPEAYVCAIAHESFHAFQGMKAPHRLAAAEHILASRGKDYLWDDDAFTRAWGGELNTLADALRATDDSTARELAGKFLRLRRDRRAAVRLDSGLVSLERQREWEEGLGKYTELWLWRRAAADSTYVPCEAFRTDPNTRRYRNFAGQWSQELSTLRLQSNAGETRFYYSGMAQAFLLDRFSPGWRNQMFENNTYLEDALTRALTARGKAAFSNNGRGIPP
jgi:hypothetical protein